MNVPSTSSNSRWHKIQISNEGNSNDGEWHRNVKEPSTIVNYSRVLAELVDSDRHMSPPKGTTSVIPKPGVSKYALKTIISFISRRLDDKPYVLRNQFLNPNDRLDRLFELAVGCWQYECLINPEWDAFSLEVKNEWSRMFNDDGLYDRIHRHRIDWMFIAIVFEWDDVFEMMYERVILNYGTTSHDNREELPKNFISLVNDKRNLETEKAYNFARDSWIEMWLLNNMSPPSMDKAYLYFHKRLGIDLRKAMLPDLYQSTDPSSLLEYFETTTDYSSEQTSNLPSPSQHSHHGSQSLEVKSIVSGGRGGGDGIFEAIESSRKDIAQAAKKIFYWKRSSRQDSLHASSLSGDGRQPSVDARTWRANIFETIPMRYSEFLTLQREHIWRRAIAEPHGELSNGQASARHHTNGEPSNGQTSARHHTNREPSNGQASTRHHTNREPSNGQASARHHTNGEPSKGQASARHHTNGEPSNGQASMRHYSNGQGLNGEPSNARSSNRRSLGHRASDTEPRTRNL